MQWGGKEAIEAVQNIDVELEISEPSSSSLEFAAGNTLNAHYRANRAGQMRIDIYVKEERVFTEALSKADEGWQQDGSEGEVTGHSADGMAALQRGIHGNLYGLHELEKLGYSIEFQALQPLCGIDYWAVDVTNPWGKIERHYFDKSSFLKVASQDESALHVDVDVDVDPTKVLKASYSYNYQMHEGVMFSMDGKVIDLHTNEVMQNVVIKNIKVNSPLDVTQFLKP